jgi:hypothetical protein
MKFDNVHRNTVRSRSDMPTVRLANPLSPSCVHRVLAGCGGGGVSDRTLVDWGIDEAKSAASSEKLRWTMRASSSGIDMVVGAMVALSPWARDLEATGVVARRNRCSHLLSLSMAIKSEQHAR